MLYPKDQKPYTPLELHVRLALFVVGPLTEWLHSPALTQLLIGFTTRPDYYGGPHYLVKKRVVAKEVVGTFLLPNEMQLSQSRSFWTMNRFSQLRSWNPHTSIRLTSDQLMQWCCG